MRWADIQLVRQLSPYELDPRVARFGRNVMEDVAEIVLKVQHRGFHPSIVGVASVFNVALGHPSQITEERTAR